MSSDQNPLFEAVLATLTDRQREHVEAAYALLEHSREPVHRQELLAFQDPTSRDRLEQLLRRTGRVLVQVDGLRFTSGYDDAVATQLTGSGWQPLTVVERAVLVLVLVYSVAIPRSEERLAQDVWTSPYPTAEEDILRASKVPAVAAKTALSKLVACGLLGRVRDRVDAEGGYVPGPQLLRLTPAVRERLQDQLILAAAPNHPLAAVIRERRNRTISRENPR
ncbi:hypothetical protein GA0070624_3398 [Micromonospora rhizosphaerae]|uniref:DprA winged helix domain-containing protein n=1 Tax=Micromonospora rhizosphaerae TaxID=568872 RepID=A0A1C6SCB1_9ACTN|nr:hypothetical protein [Micromonospora rhizosphaerae]SCL26923.1 hypothetical protein GA0070624_3398 [Micromonospora rhizosphaerae]